MTRNILSKACVTVFLLILLLLAGWHWRFTVAGMMQQISLPQVPPPAPGTIRFAVIGDYGTGSGGARDVALLVESWRPEFIATVGDNNYPIGALETIDGNIGKFYHPYISPYKGSYGPGAAVNRFFPIPGHRDWDSPTGLQPYLDYFNLPGNERYYEFVWGPVHLFMLDTDEREPDSASANSAQAEWLQRGLTRSSTPWKLVFAHHAPFTSHKVADVEYMRWPFKEWGADAVLSGFYHVYERLAVDGTPYFVNGVGGSSLSGFGEIDPNSQFRSAGSHGAILIDADESQITFRFVTSAGQILDQLTLTESTNRSSNTKPHK